MSERAYPLTYPEEDGERWPAQGEWTYEDYLRLPDDGRRYEVIRGHLYVSHAPSYEHQLAVTGLFLTVGLFVTENKLGVVLAAPFDVILTGIATPVEPDFLFFRTGNAPRSGDKNFEGIPDLLVEVLSPRTRHVDLGVKRAAYEESGVPEYWVIDPKARTLVIFGMKGDKYVELARGGVGDTVESAVLKGLRLAVADLFLF